MYTNLQIGTLIKAARKRKKISQKELAHVLKISQAFLSKIENGRKDIEFEMILKIEEFLQTSID